MSSTKIATTEAEMSTTPSGLNVSLKPHLYSALNAIQNLLPPELASELVEYLNAQPSSTSEPPPSSNSETESKEDQEHQSPEPSSQPQPKPTPLIPHSFLRAISSWAQSPSGRTSLNAHSLHPSDYNMIALLAGATTSPEKTFEPYVPPAEPEVIAAKRARERKAIAALVNSVFSVFGAGFAGWWGADRTGWRDEYKVLFGLAVGIVVAISEGVLFLIWSSRAASSTPGKKLVEKRRRYSARHKKDRDDSHELEQEGLDSEKSANVSRIASQGVEGNERKEGKERGEDKGGKNEEASVIAVKTSSRLDNEKPHLRQRRP